MKKSFLILILVAFFIFWGVWCLLWTKGDWLVVMAVISFILAFLFLIMFIVMFTSALMAKKIVKNGFETTATIAYFYDVFASKTESGDMNNPSEHGGYRIKLKYKDEKGIERSELTDKVYYGKEAQEIKARDVIRVRCRGKRVFII